MHEAVDLIRSRDPEIFQGHLLRGVDYWVSRPIDAERRLLLILPTRGLELNITKGALADRMEDVFTTTELQNNFLTTNERFTGEKALDIPLIQEMLDRKSFQDAGRCLNCAQKGHGIETCKEDFVECDYEHDGGVFPPHSILTCPVLHSCCDLCLSVGHRPQIHYDPSQFKTQFEVRRRYFRNMVRGAWTSLPFLAFTPETAKLISANHWRFSYDSVNFRRATITRYALKLENVPSVGPPRKGEEAVWERQELEEKIRRDEFAKRINAKSIEELAPLDRKFLDGDRSRVAQAKREGILNIKKLHRSRNQRRKDRRS